jgi:hypothetical protein
MSPLAARLVVPLLLPGACAWVKWQESSILKHGIPLSDALLADAKRIGVRYPERVRLRVVDQVPGGIPSWLRKVGTPLGLCSPSTSGMSLRYGIFIRSDRWGDRHLVRHELIHTQQYERLGGIRPFLTLYLFECLAAPGYPFGPLESEARELANSNFSNGNPPNSV